MPSRTRRISVAWPALAVAISIAVSAPAQPERPAPSPEPPTHADIDRPVIMAILLRHAEDLRDELASAEALLEAARNDEPFTRSQLADLGDLLRDARRRGVRLFDPQWPRGSHADRNRPNTDRPPPPAAPDTDEEPTLSDDERELIVAFLTEHRPRLARTLRSAAEESPAEVSRFIDRHGPRMLELAREWRSSPELFALRRATAEADTEAVRAAHRVAQLQETDRLQPNAEAELEEARAALRHAVRRAAALRFERAQLEIRERREQLALRQARLEEQRQRLNEIVESRAAELVDRANNARQRPRNTNDRRERQRRGPRPNPGERPQR